MTAARDYDVVVIGGGAAGMSAAITAHDSGARVLLCEAADRLGGSSAASGGIFLAAGSALQTRQGLPDEGDELFTQFMLINRWEVEPAIVRRFVDEGPAAIDWLIELGVEFLPDVIPVGQTGRRWGHVPKLYGLGETQALEAAISRRAIDIALSTRVDRLLLDDGGAVRGIAAQDTEVQSHAVVLACGGVGNADEQLLADYFPDAARHAKDWRYYIGVDSVRGDGIRLGLDAGAEIGGRNRGLLVAVPAYHGAIEGPQPGWPVLVNAQGQRFVNEQIDYSVAAHIVNQQPGGVCFAIFDDDAFNRTADDPRYRFVPIMADAPGYSWLPDHLKEGLAAGKILRADTLEALAAKIGVPPAVFVTAIEDYNRDARNGRDSHYLKDPASLVPIAAPPFYAMPRRAAEIALSAVGPRINADARVYSADGRYVPGLFAAGEAASGVFNYYVATGCSIANCIIFGRIAGRNAASERSMVGDA